MAFSANVSCCSQSSQKSNVEKFPKDCLLFFAKIWIGENRKEREWEVRAWLFSQFKDAIKLWTSALSSLSLSLNAHTHTQTRTKAETYTQSKLWNAFFQRISRISSKSSCQDIEIVLVALNFKSWLFPKEPGEDYKKTSHTTK